MPEPVETAPIHLSIIIPAYNEAALLPETLARVVDYLARQPFASETLVVDDGSSDNTVGILAPLVASIRALRVLRNPANLGKGASVRRGLLASRGRYVVFTDADLPAPLDDIARLLGTLDNGAVIAIGSRTLNPAGNKTAKPWLRRLASRVYSGLVRKILGLPFRDTQFGFKAFVRKAVLPLFEHECRRGYSFDAEILFRAQQRGLPVREVSVEWAERRPPRLRLLLHALPMFFDLLRIRWLNSS